ncbi:MAG: Transcriptional regulator, TetR family [Verrucomicrobiales bacterium]|nr:Transcriptional regulator, TetR family [Verrucomicrobiales bacterium]
MKHRDAESSTGAAAVGAEQRRKGILNAAFGIFARYGFRKTSMDEVATAAGISRQGLYLHFATKEELFRALVAYVLDTSFTAAETVLKDRTLPLDVKLAHAFQEWVGRHVGVVGVEAADLIQAAHSLMGDEVRDYERRFSEAVTAAVRRTDLAKAFARSGVAARHLASHLLAVARGLKCQCASQAEFTQEFSIALRILFAVVAGPEKAPPPSKTAAKTKGGGRAGS